MNPATAFVAPKRHPDADSGSAPQPSSFAGNRPMAAALPVLSRSVAFISGVRVMRISRHFSTYAGANSVEAIHQLFRPESVKASAAVAVESEPHVIELSTLQKIALLRMAGSTLCRGVATHLQNENDLQSKPSIFDYRALVAHGLSFKPLGDDWHKITPRGSSEAMRIAKQIARDLSIHILIEGGREGFHQNFSCACGQWGSSVKRGQFTERNALFGFNRHCAKASPMKETESA